MVDQFGQFGLNNGDKPHAGICSYDRRLAAKNQRLARATCAKHISDEERVKQRLLVVIRKGRGEEWERVKERVEKTFTTMDEQQQEDDDE